MGLFNHEVLSREDIIAFLKTSPEKLAAFESFYKTQVLTCGEPRATWRCGSAEEKTERLNALTKLVNNIVMELASQTAIYVYDGRDGKVNAPAALPDNYRMVSADDIAALPRDIQPQLAGNLMKTELSEESAPALLFYLKKMQEEDNVGKKRFMYHHFRQGLDILDLDSLTYAMIDKNRNSMGHWLPQLVTAN